MSDSQNPQNPQDPQDHHEPVDPHHRPPTIIFGQEFKMWLMAKVLLTCLVLSAIGAFLYHKVTHAQEKEDAQNEKAAAGIAGTPVLYNVTEDWFKDKIKAADAGLKLTEENIKGLQLATAAAVASQTRPLPPQVGTLNYDNETMFLVKSRFSGPAEVVSVMKVKDKIYTDEPPYEKTIERPLKFGDKVKQGDVLAVFWSVTLGTAKAAFVDGISAVRLSQDTWDRHLKLFNDGALPLGTLRQDERQLQGDNNNLMTAERTLRMWKMSDDEINALRDEANEILDSLLLHPDGRITKIDATGLTLMLSKEDKEGKVYKFAKDVKFFRRIKRDEKEEIKEGLKAPIFQKIGKKGLGAIVVTNKDQDVTEVLVGKERDVLEEVNRWARTEVYVPWFDKAHPDRELTLLEKNTNIGDMVDSTNFGTWLFRVADMSRLQIWVHPPEEYLPIIRKAMAKKNGLKWDIRFQSEPEAPAQKLRVEQISPSLEPNQHNPMVVGYMPNSEHKYLAGQFVTATISMPPEDDTVEIPTDALNELKGQSFVFVKDKAFVKDQTHEAAYCLKRVAVVRRYADYTIVRSKLGKQDEAFSKEEVKNGRYPLRPLDRDEQVVTRGVVELTTALDTAITKASVRLQK